MKGALLAIALAAGGGGGREPPAASCVADNVPFVARALPDILALTDPAPAALEAGFVLCSRHEDRLLAATEALAALGYSSYLGAADKGKCLRFPSRHEASVAAMEREMTAMCRISESHRISYRYWQTEIGGKSVRLAGGRLMVYDRRSR